MKVSAPSKDEGKINRRARRDHRVFLGKDKKHKSFYGNGVLFAFGSCGNVDKRVNEEEAESAEIVP